MKWPTKTAVLLIGIAMSFGIFSSKTYAECRPLLVMHGGLFDEMTGNVENLAKSIQSIQGNIDVQYYGHYERKRSRDYIKNHHKSCPNSPVALIGHSLGGAAAYDVAADWGVRIQLLATLDAVGGRAYPGYHLTEFREDLEKPDNVRKWVNVWIDPPGSIKCILFLGAVWDSDDCLADAGAQWLFQKNAENIEFKGRHGHRDATGMFCKISSHIESAFRIRFQWSMTSSLCENED